MMMFQYCLLSFSSLSLVYDPYEHVPISYAVGDKIWQRKMIQQNWTKSIIIFIIELGIWVVMAWRPPQYRRGKRTSCTGLMSDHCVVHVVSLRFALPQYTLNPDSSLIIVWRCNGWPYFGDKRFFRCVIISCLQFFSQWVSQQYFFRS